MRKKYTNSELCLIWLDSFLGLEYKHKQELFKLIDGKDGIKEVLEKGIDYVIANVGQNEYDNLLHSASSIYLNYVIDGLESKGVQAVTIVSSEYPESLKNTSIPPLVLYAKGNLDLLNKDIFGIVGSRNNLPLSIALAKKYSQVLSDCEFTIVTGIAQGVDQTVLETVLENGGKAISVMGGGFDNVYPKSNENLVNKLAEKGLVITEYPPEVVAMPYHFPIRNRIIAGLCKGLLVVSGAKKSGTQYTAYYAEEYGKDVFAIPYSVGIESGTGCNDLIKKGAILTDTPDDILEFYGIEKKESETIEFSPEEQKVIDVLKDGQKHVQEMCNHLNMQIYQMTPILASLEIKGVINKSGINVYGLTLNVQED